VSSYLPAATWSLSEVMTFIGPRIALAVVCGGIVGLERELKNKPAGIKTNILICVGSALYTSVSILISESLAAQGHFGDPGRLAAQIVSGIGFLGGGTIIQARGTILGLTTAATIWVVAAIGLCVGIGRGDIALLCSLVVVGLLVMTNWFEDRILGRSLTFACEVTTRDSIAEIRGAVQQSLERNDLVLDDFDIVTKGDLSALTLRYSGHKANHKKFILELWGLPALFPGIQEVRQK
jgi:putative Mg2+ transporter-C (MgtC) family protein